MSTGTANLNFLGIPESRPKNDLVAALTATELPNEPWALLLPPKQTTGEGTRLRTPCGKKACLKLRLTFNSENPSFAIEPRLPPSRQSGGCGE